MIRFTVPAVPVAQPRQRHRVLTVAGRTFAQNYTPEKSSVNSFKASVRHAASQAYSGPPLDGALKMRVVFLLPRPGRLRWKTRPMPRMPHTSRPDADNLWKALADALKGRVWIDDAQVSELKIFKLFASGDEQPHVEIRISEIDGTDGLFKE